MEPSSDFRWPDDPPQDWWEATGAQLRLKPEHIRFAAAVAQLGGTEARKNSVAARLAGVEGGRTYAFRVARSVGVRKLLAEATKIVTGKLPRLSEEEIDQKIDDLIRSPDAGTAAKGIELRAKREAARQEFNAATADDPRDPEVMIVSFLEAYPDDWRGALAAFSLFRYSTSSQTLDDLGPHIAADFPDVWRRQLEMIGRPLPVAGERKPVAQIISEARERISANAQHWANYREA